MNSFTNGVISGWKTTVGGTVATQNLKVGEYVNMGQAMVTLADLSQWGRDVCTEGETILMSVSEEDALPQINRCLVESAPMAICVQQDGRCVYLNQAGLDLFHQVETFQVVRVHAHLALKVLRSRTEIPSG